MRKYPLCYFCLLILTISCGGGSGGSSSSNSSPPQNPETSEQDPLEEVELVTPNGEIIQTDLVYTQEEQEQGLQNVQDSEFSHEQGMLFFYLEDEARTFWMPNTYFDLDIIYLDENLIITNIVRDMPHYEGDVNSEIPRAPTITSRHVLEMKASSPISSELEIGDTLQWESSLSLDETENQITEELNEN